MPGPPLTITSFGATDVGRKRQSNEDAFLVDDALGLYVVADGMGGHSSGEVASAEAVETLHGMVVREREALLAMDSPHFDPSVTPGAPPSSPALQKAQRVLESAVQAATYMVFGLGEANPDQ